MGKIKLNLCSIGDPTNRKTWSGTPFNLYSELAKADCLASAFRSAAISNKYEAKLVKAISRLYYQNSVDVERGFLYRYLNSKKVKNQTLLSNSKLTLHTGTLDLPFFKRPHDQKHYLFCDSTWNLWLSNTTHKIGYTKTLLNDAEKLERKAYNQMEHIFPISEYVKDNLIGHYDINPGKITVVGTGLGVIKSYHGPKNYSNGKILFAAKGRFEDKGGPLVLEAFKIALKSNPNLEMTIVGQNEYTKEINFPNVKVHGFIPLEQLQNIFNDCSLFLMPATNEPWGLVYLEALACKVPIVGLNRNSFPELSGYGKYGFGIDEADPLKLSEVIVQAFSNPERLAQMAENGQNYCLSKFSWANTVGKIITVIENSENE